MYIDYQSGKFSHSDCSAFYQFYETFGEYKITNSTLLGTNRVSISKVCAEDTICGPCFDVALPDALEAMEIDLGNQEPLY